MLVQITKRADGAGVLRCIRDDGSITWQKQQRHAAHFALHDLTHYAVETTLGSQRGFFGLVAEGWEIEDTTGKGAQGRLPPEATDVESIVGLFDTERASGTHLDARRVPRIRRPRRQETARRRHRSDSQTPERIVRPVVDRRTR